MDLDKLAKSAEKFIDQHGGTDTLKQEAEDLKEIAAGDGTLADKAKQAAQSAKEYSKLGPDGQPR